MGELRGQWPLLIHGGCCTKLGIVFIHNVLSIMYFIYDVRYNKDSLSLRHIIAKWFKVVLTESC